MDIEDVMDDAGGALLPRLLLSAEILGARILGQDSGSDQRHLQAADRSICSLSFGSERRRRPCLWLSRRGL